MNSNSEIFRLLNKTAIRDEMTKKPKGQRLHSAFDGEWDLLTDIELEELCIFLAKEFTAMGEELIRVCNEREIIT